VNNFVQEPNRKVPERHPPYGITQCYLLQWPNTGEHALA